MIKIVIGALVVAWVFAGVRNFPRLEHPQTAAACFVIASCVWGAYWLGTRSKRAAMLAQATAVAIAEARATAESNATASVNVAVVVPENGARAAGDAMGLDRMPWIVQETRPELADDAVDSVLADVLHNEAREAEG